MTKRQPKTPAAPVAGEPGTPPPGYPRTGVDGVPGPTSPSLPPGPHSGSEGEAKPLRGEAWRKAARKTKAGLHWAQRNRRGKKTADPIVGVRAASRRDER